MIPRTFFKVAPRNANVLCPAVRLALWAPLLVAAYSSPSFSANSSSSYPRLTPVQETSLLVAYWRHLETTRATADPLIKDVAAGILVNTLLPKERQKEFQNSPIRECGQDVLAVRTRIIDDWLLQSTKTDGKSTINIAVPRDGRRQLVNLGAGMCARYYRLGTDLAQRYCHMWEIDSDLELLNIKRRVLEQHYDAPTTITTTSTHTATSSTTNAFDLSEFPLTCLQGDLAAMDKDGDALVTAFHESDFSSSNALVPTDWIVEGVLEYLHPHQHAPILDFCRRLSMPGSRMVLQVLDESMRTYFDTLFSSKGNLPWKDLPPLDTFVELAETCGWEVERIVTPPDWNGLYSRELSYVPGFHMVFLRLP